MSVAIPPECFYSFALRPRRVRIAYGRAIYLFTRARQTLSVRFFPARACGWQTVIVRRVRKRAPASLSPASKSRDWHWQRPRRLFLSGHCIKFESSQKVVRAWIRDTDAGERRALTCALSFVIQFHARSATRLAPRRPSVNDFPIVSWAAEEERRAQTRTKTGGKGGPSPRPSSRYTSYSSTLAGLMNDERSDLSFRDTLPKSPRALFAPPLSGTL